MKRFLPMFFALALAACEEPWSPETAELSQLTFVLRELEYSATIPKVTLQDTLPGGGHLTMQFGKNRTVRVTGSLNFSRWGPSAVHPEGQPYRLLSEGDFVGTYKFTNLNTLEMSFPSATGANAWLSGQWKYDWDGKNFVPFQLSTWMRVVLKPINR